MGALLSTRGWRRTSRDCRRQRLRRRSSRQSFSRIRGPVRGGRTRRPRAGRPSRLRARPRCFHPARSRSRRRGRRPAASATYVAEYMPASRPSGSASRVRVSPPGSVIREATLALSSGRYSASRTRTVSSMAAVADESALGRTETSTRPGTSPTSQRTVCRHDRSRSLSVGILAGASPAPEVADQQGADMPLAELLGHERRARLRRRRRDLARARPPPA